MIISIALLLSLSQNHLFLFPNNTNPPSYRLVQIMKAQDDMSIVRSLTDHNSSVCAKDFVSIEDIKHIVPFSYAERVYVDQGYATKSGTVVGMVQGEALIHYENSTCYDYARPVNISNILPLNK